MNELIEELAQRAADEVAAIHDIHVKKLLKKNGLDFAKYSKDPAALSRDGYELVHKREGDTYILTLAKVVDTDKYSVRVKLPEIEHEQ